MNLEQLIDNLNISKEKIKYNEPMAKHTSFKIGGPAQCFINAESVEEIKQICKVASKNDINLTEEEKKEEFKGGGDRFFLGNPGYLLHDLQGDRINTHYQTIPTGADYSGPWPFKYYEGEED